MWCPLHAPFRVPSGTAGSSAAGVRTDAQTKPRLHSVSPRLGLRSRILALTLPVVVLVSAALAAVLYLSLGQVLESSARDIASAEVQELRADLRLHTIEDLAVTHDVRVGTRVSQVVDDAGQVVVNIGSAVARPMVDPVIAPGGLRVDVVDEVPGSGAVVAVAGSTGPGVDGRRYRALVAVATRVETTAFTRSLEFALIGAIGLVALLAAVTTFAVGQALRPVDRLRHEVEDLAASAPAPTLGVPPGATSSPGWPRR